MSPPLERGVVNLEARCLRDRPTFRVVVERRPWPPPDCVRVTMTWEPSSEKGGVAGQCFEHSPGAAEEEIAARREALALICYRQIQREPAVTT